MFLLACDPPTYASHVVGIIAIQHYAQFVGWDGVSFLTSADFQPQSSRSPPARITGMYHYALPTNIF
jgi:hypothetical protein